MIIPTDDEPGAKEAKVGDYIDFVVFSAQEFKPSLGRELAKVHRAGVSNFSTAPDIQKWPASLRHSDPTELLPNRRCNPRRGQGSAVGG